MRIDTLGSLKNGKVGAMIRETLDVGSRNVCLALTPANGVSLQWRDAINGTTASSQTSGPEFPYWVRLSRTSNVFKAEWSADGRIWIQCGTDTAVVMTASVHIGVALTSQDVTTMITSYVSNVSLTGTVPGVWQSYGIGIATRTNDPARMYLTVEDTAGKRNTLGGYDPDDTVTGYWGWLPISLSDLGSAGVDVSAVKKLTIRVGDKTDPKPGGTGLLYIDDLSFGHARGGVRLGGQ